ncbi:type II toxin-antitoxin system Phd/YefM family antitoxin [bacterium]|nr:type II toxin-antitoxin system Phd/YefM family antitoxin [bacterium]
MKIYPAGKFKALCLSVLDEVSKKREPVLVTKRGKPVAQVVPVPDSEEDGENPLIGSVIFEKNIIDPVDEEWENG